MTLTPEHISQIEQAIAQTAQRVLVLDINDTKVVIKRKEPPRGQLGRSVLGVIARILGQTVLIPVPSPGGEVSQQVEVNRLKSLYAAGVTVPRVLHVAPDWFAIEYLGSESIGAKLVKGEQPPSFYWRQGLAAILDVHHKGQNLSQVFVRNAMWREEGIAFIDFEDDPAATIGLTHAQARDWLFYLFSSIWTLEISPNQAARELLGFLQQDNPEITNILKKSARTLSWLRILPSKRKPWGRDVVATQGVAAVLHELCKMVSEKIKRV